jgi:hypothetical protein
MVPMHARSRTQLAWLLFLATFGCLAGGLVVTLVVTRRLTVEVLVDGAVNAGVWLLFATIGLVLTLRRPSNPIGWLYAAAGLVWTAYIPWIHGSPSCCAAAVRCRWLPSWPPWPATVAGGGWHHPWHHPAVAAAAQRAVAVAPLAAGGGRQHRRHDH